MFTKRLLKCVVLGATLALLGGVVWLPGAASAAACPCSVWSDSETPATPTANDGQPIEVGTKFRADEPGDVTGLRFYRGPGTTGTFLGHLWASTGTQLAEVTFPDASPGWQTAMLGSAVPIAADTTYVTSYWSSDGYFAIDAGYFASSGVDNPPLHALQAGVDGVNGVYRYGASGFPSDGNTANYWADVIFAPQPVEPPGPAFVDTTTTDFQAGTIDTNTQVSDAGSGEVILLPAVGEDFSGDALPAGWFVTSWSGGSSGAIVTNGALIVDGARVGTDALFGPSRSLEFQATFASGTPFQHVGFGNSYEDAPWAMFSTGASGTTIQARTWASGGTPQDTDLGSGSIGSSHRYRIQWNADTVDFFIDGTSVTSHAVTIATDMRPLASDFNLGEGTLSVDWLRLSPYASSGTFLSRIFDAGAITQWGAASWTAALPTSTSIIMSVRTGDTPTPDSSWTDFAMIPSSGDPVGAQSRYIQYRAELATADADVTPALRDVRIEYEEAAGLAIDSFTPSGGTVGAIVTITGSGFTDTSSVSFNGIAAQYQVDSDTQLGARVPREATTGPITVTTPDGTATSSDPFSVMPRIAYFSPASGPVGTEVKIKGSAFTGATAVEFNGTVATGFVVRNYRTITVTVPEGATTGHIKVVTPSGDATTARPFTVTG
jgi:uncharacterized protein DUF4082/IPT/TIG domain-containing protein